MQIYNTLNVLQEMGDNLRFAFSVGDTAQAVSKLVLNKTYWIGDTRYNI